jgi:hypothetical protein
VTTPAPPPQQPQPRPVGGPWYLSRVLLVIGTILFVLAAFAAGGHPLAGVADWCWAFGAFAAWVLSGAVP